MSTMKLARVSAQTAALIDRELMGSQGFSIDQLMELAGQAVAHTVYKVHPPSKGKSVLVLAGPGNNGGDGLVASRHLKLLGYEPSVYYPKPSHGQLYDNLQTQIRSFGIPTSASSEDLATKFASADFIIDALFGFSFHPPVRESFVPVMTQLVNSPKPVLAVDIPSSWNVDNGPDSDWPYQPAYLISLTAPKSSANFFKGRHFIGGRFISEQFAAKHGFDVPPYEGVEQIYEEK